MLDQFEFVGFWKRVGVALIDIALSFPLWPLFTWAHNEGWRRGTVAPILVVNLADTFAFIALVHYFGGTPGKLILKMRIIGRDAQYLSWNKAIRREAISITTMFLTVAPLWWTFRQIEPGNYAADAQQKLLERYTGLFWAWTYGCGIVQCIDVAWVATNRHRRAIHDYIAGSYVVTKRSLDAVLATRPPELAPQPADV